MAIQFARARFVSRSKRGNAVRSAAYNMRDEIYDQRTSERHHYEDRHDTLIHHEILLPNGAAPHFYSPAILWNMAEAAEHRKNSQVALEIVIALPADPSVSDADRLALARSFAQQHFVDRGLAVQIDSHTAHAASADALAESTNPHAHLLITTRRIEGPLFASHKARDLQPTIRRLRYGPAVVAAETWGPIWRDHQNKYFRDHGKALEVDPVAPFPGEHIGPTRFRHPDDPRIAHAEKLQAANAAVARNPETLAAHLSQQRHFDGQALDRFLTKHLPPEEREAIAVDVRTRLHNLQREALIMASWSDKVASGLRPLSVEDVARAIEPQYADLIKRAAELREQIRQEERNRDWHDLNKHAATYRAAERWAEMGIARRIADRIGTAMPRLAVLRDLELQKWSSMLAGGTYMVDNKGIKKGAAEGELAQVTRQAESMLDPNHPLGRTLRSSGLTLRQEAEMILTQRQNIAQNARAALQALHTQDRQVLRQQRSQKHVSH